MRVNTQRYLSSRQLAVMDDLFAGELSEAEVLKKHGVRTVVYRRWLGTKVFSDELAFRIEAARRESEIMIAKYARVAAVKLVELTGSNKGETARRACLDIVSCAGVGGGKKKGKSAAVKKDKLNAQISPKVASKLLGVLAKEKKS